MKNQKRIVNTNQFVNFIDLIYNFNKEVKGFNIVTRHGEYYSEIMNINDRDVFIMIPEIDGAPYIVAFDDYFFDALSEIIKNDFNGLITILSLVYKDESKEDIQKECVWHDAKKDPPEDNIPVLVTFLGYNDKKPYNNEVAYIENGEWHWNCTDELVKVETDGLVKVEITHWTELPELPKCYKNKD